MRELTEDKVKTALAAYGLPVPEGMRATTPAEAQAATATIGGPVVVKALVATGRRGHAGAVRFADTPEQTAAHAAALIGTTVNGRLCRAVWVEQRVSIARELYLSFVLDEEPARVLLSLEGGVDIEAVHRDRPERIVKAPVPTLRGLPVWDAVALCEKAGLDNAHLAAVAGLTARLWQFFVAHDGVMLELNPIAIDPEGRPHLVGAMMATEDPMFTQADEEDDPPVEAGPEATARRGRERRMIAANRDLPGGMIRYTELDGDIGMFVGGGGAGLHQHDLILAAGGRPANHTDASTVNPDKVRALIDVILDNPRVNSLFVSWHYQQMAQIDKRVIPALEAIQAHGLDPREFPVVIRMFGPGEDKARAAAARVPGVHYMPHGAPMTDGIDLIVRLTEQARARRAARGEAV